MSIPGTMDATPAVQHAGVEITSHLGVRPIEMPAGSRRVWSPLQEVR